MLIVLVSGDGELWCDELWFAVAAVTFTNTHKLFRIANGSYTNSIKNALNKVKLSESRHKLIILNKSFPLPQKSFSQWAPKHAPSYVVFGILRITAGYMQIFVRNIIYVYIANVGIS